MGGPKIRFFVARLTCYSAGIDTPSLIGFVLFMILYFPIVYFIPAYKVQKLLEVQVVVAAATLLGIMGWAVHVSIMSNIKHLAGTYT